MDRALAQEHYERCEADYQKAVDEEKRAVAILNDARGRLDRTERARQVAWRNWRESETSPQIICCGCGGSPVISLNPPICAECAAAVSNASEK